MIFHYFVLAGCILPALCQIPPGQPQVDDTQTFILGNDYTVSCTSAGGNPTPSVLWYRGQNQITTGIQTSTANSVTTTTLTFTATRAEHLAVFRCEADNGVLQNALTATLFVYVNFASQPPTITGPTNLVAGNSGTWTCTAVDGYPAPAMTARIVNNQFIDEFTTNNQYVTSTQSYTVTGTLNWSPSVANNGQSICCDVTNAVVSSTPQTVCLQLTVRSPLAVLAPTLQYNPTIGTTVTLTCQVTSGTATGISWTKDRNTLTIDNRYSGGSVSTPSLTISGVVQSDGGNYVCQATDGTATVNTNTINVSPRGTPPAVTLPQTTYSQVTGQSVTIQCTVSSPNSPLQEVQWTFTSQGGVTTDPIIIPTGTSPKYQGSSITSASLIINNVQSSDQGSYRCRARNLIGTTLSAQTAVLTVTGSIPVVQVTNPTYSVVYGNQVTLGCNIVSAVPGATLVYWQKQSSGGILTRIDNGASGTQGSTVSSPSLTINFVTTSDAGTYTCYATNVVGTGQSTTSTLTVTGGLLTVSISPSSSTINQGSSTTITCTITGTPAAQSVQWVKDGTQLSISTSGGKYSGGTTTTPSLTITNFQSSDAGTYVCRATNAAGTASSTNSVLSFRGLLTVTVSPSTNTVILGTSSVTIQCTIQGTHQATSWEWTKTPINGGTQTVIAQGTNDGHLQVVNSATNPNLIISNIVEADEAVYRCRANNGAGLVTSQSSTLVVNGDLPTISVEPSQFTGTIGDASYQIQCSVTAVPPATSWYWTFTPLSGGAATTIQQGTNNQDYLMDSSNTKPHLTIKNLAKADEGDYKCFAINLAGTGQSSASRLNVAGDILSVTISPVTANVIRGNTQTITCSVSGTPAANSISWTKDGSTLNIANSGGKYSGGTTGNPSLTINNFQTSDAGTYSCSATNAAGTGSSLPQTSVLTYVEFLTLTATPASGNADIGAAQYIINCQISGTPQATSYFWTKNPTNGDASSTINQGTNSAKYTVASSVTNPSLTIKNIAQSDDANYVCTATNTAGTRSSASARLLVTGAIPQISATPLLQSPTYGASSAVIQCSISAQPAATSVGWRKISLDGSSTTNIDAANSNGKYAIANSLTAPHLTINNIDFTDDANYVCFATNAVGTGSSNNARIDVIGTAPTVVIPQNAYSVVFGDDITIPCQITGANPSHTAVNWYYAANSNSQFSSVNVGDVSQYAGGTLNTPSLTIRNANSQDAGLYRCGATNVVGEGLSGNTQLTVMGGLLTVTIPSPTYSVLLGNQVSITCTVSGTPTATNVFWQKQQAGGAYSNVDIAGNNRYSGGTIANPTLVITNAQFSDEGNYRCHAQNAAGTAQSIVTNLDVTGNPPTVTIVQTSFPALIGNDITLGCNVISNPPATNVYWLFTDTGGQTKTITPSTNTNKYGGITTSSPSLILYNAEFSDNGQYVCYATNSVGTGNSQPGTVTVTGQVPSVTVTSANNDVDFGNQVTLGCSVVANPAHFRVFWRKIKDGATTDIDVASSNGKYAGSTVSAPSLVINDAALNDQASYVCLAENSVGIGSSTTTVLSVLGNIPVVSISQFQYNVDFGDTVTLTCTVTANPAHTNVYWRKIQNGQTSVIDSNVVANDARLSGSSVNTPSLTITNVNLSDIASYICLAENSVGTGQSSQTSLAVSGGLPQVAVLSNSYQVSVGGTVTLQCVVTSNPQHTSVKWQRIVNGQFQDVTNVGAPGSNSRLTGSVVNTPSLTISQASFTDEGNYICTATNAIGTGQSGQTFLDVTGTTPVVQVTQNEFQGDFGQSATLVCTVTANPTETRVYWKMLMANGQLQDIDMTGSRYSGSTVGSPSLTITGLTKADQAFYQCFADNSVGTGSSSQTFLRVIGDIPLVTVPSTHTFTLGTNAVLTCTVTANPAATSVFWQKFNNQNSQWVNVDLSTNNNNKYQGSTTGVPSLTILSTVNGDAGQYRCNAVNAVGIGTSGTTTLDITGALPIVNIPQSQYTINIGNQVTLTCTISATPKETDVYWTKKVGTGAETQISKTNTAKYQGQTVNSPSLVILNTDFNDIATYKCYATNTVGTGQSNPTSLTVSGNLPNVVIPLTGYSVNYAGSITIPCTITAQPAVTSVQWKRVVNGLEQNIDTSLSKYSGGTTSTPALTISSAVQSDETFYICTATNSVGTGRSLQTYLDVLGDVPAVTIASNSYSVLKTQNIELVCNIVANPAATSVQWYRYDGGVQSNLRTDSGKYNSPTVASPNLMINNADDQDRGYYICTATNLIGRGTSQSTFVDVYGNAPVVNIPLNSYNGNIGGSVTIDCTVIANPAATTVYWVKQIGGQNTQISMSNNKYSFSVNSPSLIISNLDQSDEANYICYAQNSVGSGNSQTTNLDVIGSIPQVTIPAPSYDVNIGQSATLVCNVQANPTHTSVFWRRVDANNQATSITIDGTKYSGSTVSNPSLTINNVQLSDRQNYICFATNSVGQGQSSTTYLNVIGNSPVVNIGSATYTVPWGDSITLVCNVNSNPAHTAVTWKRIKNGVETVIDATTIANNPNKYGGGSVSSPSLIIKQASGNTDQAFYECSATNSIGTGTSSRTFLTVTGSVPLVSIPQNYQVEIGQNVVVVCSITSNPQHFTVQWKRRDNNNAVTNIDTSDQTQYSGGNLNTPSLTILNAANNDEGFYICTATNVVGQGSSQAAYVDVTGSVLQVIVPQNVYNGNYGQSVQLVCTVSGSPAATEVYWVKVSNGVSTTIRSSNMDTSKYSGVTLSDPSLTVLNVNEADAAVYTCYATNLVGTGQSQQTQLNVIGSKPTVNVGQGYTVNLGNPVTLQCTVIATPSAISVRWNKVSTSGVSTPIDVVNNPAKYSGATLNVPSLTIFNAANSDQSSYTCQATNAAGTTVSAATSLTVVGNLPVVTISQSQYSMTVGQSVTLGCTVSANPTHTMVYWQKIVNGVPQALPTDNRYSGSTVSNPSLTISNLMSGDIGNYKCYATNSVGTGESAQTYLNVVGSVPVVSIQSTSYSINIGNTITLECSVTANPQYTSVKWQKYDASNNPVDVDMTNSRYSGSTVSTPSLVISNAVKADEGRYICLATNLVGTGTSPQSTFLTVVGSIPSVNVPQNQYSVNKGSSVTLQCSYTANPSATMVRWERTVGNTVTSIGDTSTQNKYSGSTVSSPSLVINNADESDEGNYICKVTNSLGTGISSSTNLDVVGNIPQVTVSQDAYTVNVGDSVTFQCAVTSDPQHTSVYWQKVSGGVTSTIAIDNTKYTGSSVNTPSLTINNAAFNDAGTYYCYATNAIGTGGSTQVVLGVSGTQPTVTLSSTTFTANYGDDVILGCTVSANPAHTSVYWQKIVTGSNPITIDTTNTNKYSGSTVSTPSLTIKNVNANDNGRYKCFAANTVGTGQSQEGTLTVVGSEPSVTIPQNTYTINIGNSITIGCTIVSNPAHTVVYWTKKIGNNPEQTITTGGSPTKYGGSTLQSPALIIYNVDENDEGQYFCHATNIVGTGSNTSPTYLNVVGNVPVVTASVVNSVKIGQSVTLNCDVVANPAATSIRWQFLTSSSTSTVDILNNNRYSGGTRDTPSLTINPVQASDEGNYRCQATNDVGTGTSNQIFLDTTGDPPTSVTITPNPITVVEGNLIEATCSATGVPNPTYEWTKSGSTTVIATGAVLRFTNAQESHIGTYICKASNPFGSNTAQVSVDVQYVPRVTITDLAVEGKKTASAVIPCEFKSNPQATQVRWTKFASGTTVQLNIDGNKYQGSTLLSPSLTIYNLDRDDAASYRCEVTNSVGTGVSEYGTLTVDLTFAPMGINIYPGQITVLEGNSFSIYCNATANPDPQYEWYHKDVMVKQGQTITIPVSNYNAHDGLYTCKAFNSAGLQQATIDVDVKYPPISAVSQNSFTPTLGNGVTLTCDTLANPSAITWKWKYNNFELPNVDEKTYFVDMDSTTDFGQYSCIAYNEVGNSQDIVFTITQGTVAVSTTTPATGTTPSTGAAVAASSGLTGGEIAAISLGILFFILLIIVLLVCCILQGCCGVFGAGKEKEKVQPDSARIVDVPRFYEVPTVVTREPSVISRRDVGLHLAPTVYSDERYMTSAARPYYLPAIEYTYDEEERRRRRRKKKRSKRHDDLQREEQIVLEERVVGGGDVYRTSGRRDDDVEVVTGPEFYFEAE